MINSYRNDILLSMIFLFYNMKKQIQWNGAGASPSQSFPALCSYAKRNQNSKPSCPAVSGTLDLCCIEGCSAALPEMKLPGLEKARSGLLMDVRTRGEIEEVLIER